MNDVAMSQAARGARPAAAPAPEAALARRPRGRPRDARADTAILKAARDLFIDLELALAAIVGSVMFLRFTQRLRDMPDDLPERIVRQAIHGLGRQPERGSS